MYNAEAAATSGTFGATIRQFARRPPITNSQQREKKHARTMKAQGQHVERQRRHPYSKRENSSQVKEPQEFPGHPYCRAHME